MFVEYIRARLHKQNRNYLCAFVGPTGSGKTYCAMRLAERVDKDFNISQVCFTAHEFMDLLNSGKLKRGSVIVFDEAGVAANSRNFQTTVNKLLHFVNQTFRSMNYCVIYTCPDFSFLDLGIRKLVHAILETKKIDYEREVVWVKPLMIENNPQSGRIYMKYPRFRSKENPRVKKAITRMYFHKPNEKLIEAYENRKLAFNKKLQADIQTTFNKKGEEKGAAPPDMKAILQEVSSNKKKYLTTQGTLNEGRVALDFGIGSRRIARLRHLLASDSSPS